MKIDWGNVTPTSEVRDAAEISIEPSADLAQEIVMLRKYGPREYEAYVVARPPQRPATLLLRGSDPVDVIGRAARLLRVIAAQRRTGRARRS